MRTGAGTDAGNLHSLLHFIMEKRPAGIWFKKGEPERRLGRVLINRDCSAIAANVRFATKVINFEQNWHHLSVYLSVWGRVDPLRLRLSMNDFSYAIDANITRFRNLLETAVDETERRTIQSLLTEEVAKKADLPSAN